MKTYTQPKRSEWSRITSRPSVDTSALLELAVIVFEDVRTNGDEAITRLTQRYDNIAPVSMVLNSQEIQRYAMKTPAKLRQAIDQAYDNVMMFHKTQQISPQPRKVRIVPGVTCWQEERPIERVGLYVPGGSAPLISTAIMLGVPAQIADCTQVTIATPPDANGKVPPAICYVATKVGVKEILCTGGMQAIAAMTIGTESVSKVDKLFGPGNQYVMAAKQFAINYGVASDMPAGPSEVLVLADDSAVPEYVAADLLSQAEHGPDSQVVLVSTSKALIKKVKGELKVQLTNLPRKQIASKALDNSFFMHFENLDDALDFTNEYAPEHAILSINGSQAYTSRILNAGSVFLGNYSPESAGDYASGTNHTLPTGGWARSYSGLSVNSFTKMVTFQELTKTGLMQLSDTIQTLAKAEGLTAHANAVSIRLKDDTI